MTFTPAQRNAAIVAANALILKKIRSEVPGMFEGTAESALPQHRADVADIVDAVIAALSQ